MLISILIMIHSAFGFMLPKQDGPYSFFLSLFLSCFLMYMY